MFGTGGRWWMFFSAGGIALMLKAEDVKSACLFECIGDPQKTGFVERLAEELETDGELFPVFLNQSTRDADPADSGEVGCDGKDVCEIHAERVVDSFANFEG